MLVTGLSSDGVRLEKAGELGFDTAEADDSDAIRSSAGGRGFDVTIECSGSAGGATACLTFPRRGARYVQIGVFGKPVTVPLDGLFERELVATSGFASTPRSWRRAMSFIEDRSVALEPLVSEIVSLDDWERVFEATRAGKGVKYVFDPRL